MSDDILIPRTPQEKLEVLTKARETLSTNFGQRAWVKMVDGTEQYCLYGAIEAAMGHDLKGELLQAAEYNGAYDKEVDSCSLTNTMYRAAVESGSINPFHMKRIEALESNDQKLIASAFPYDNIQFLMGDGAALRKMDEKRNALQAINDDQGKEAVLAVVDAAIEALRVEVDAS